MPSCSRMRRSSPRIRSRRLASSAPRGSSRSTSSGRMTSVRARRDALLLSARDLVDGAVLEAFEAHELKHFQRARARLMFGRRLRAIAQTESDIVEHREMRKEREVLKDEADVPEIGRTGGDVLALQENASALQRLETRDCAQQHGLARAARAEERYILAGVDRERNVVERRALAKKLGQAFQSQNRNFGHGLSHGSNGLRRRQGRMSCPLARASRRVKTMKAKMSNVCN